MNMDKMVKDYMNDGLSREEAEIKAALEIIEYYKWRR